MTVERTFSPHSCSQVLFIRSHVGMIDDASCEGVIHKNNWRDEDETGT